MTNSFEVMTVKLALDTFCNTITFFFRKNNVTFTGICKQELVKYYKYSI